MPSPQHYADYPENYWRWLAGTPTDEQDIDGQRMSLAASRLAASARAADGPVIAITHAFVIGWIVRMSLAAPAAAWMTLSPANAGLTTFDCTKDRLQLVSYNETVTCSCTRPDASYGPLSGAAALSAHAATSGLHAFLKSATVGPCRRARPQSWRRPRRVARCCWYERRPSLVAL